MRRQRQAQPIDRTCAEPPAVSPRSPFSLSILVPCGAAIVVGGPAPAQSGDIARQIFAGTSDPTHAKDANWQQRLRLLSGKLAARTERPFLAAARLRVIRSQWQPSRDTLHANDGKSVRAALTNLKLLPLAPDRCVYIPDGSLLLRLGSKPLWPLANGCRGCATIIGNNDEYCPVVTQAPDGVGVNVLAHLKIPVRVARNRIEDVSDHTSARSKRRSR